MGPIRLLGMDAKRLKNDGKFESVTFYIWRRHHLRTCVIQINKKHEEKFRKLNNKKQLRVVNMLSFVFCAIHL